MSLLNWVLLSIYNSFVYAPPPIETFHSLITTFVLFFFRKLQSRLGGKEVLKFYQEVPKHNFNFCYLNTNKNYIINQVDQLFLGEKAIMFSNGDYYIIHKADQPCSDVNEEEDDNQPHHSTSVQEFVKENYPKQKHLKLIFDILEKHDLFDDNLFCRQFTNIHLADICSFFLNRFFKNDKTDGRYIKFCKFLQQKGVKLPRICVKNPYAQKLLC